MNQADFEVDVLKSQTADLAGPQSQLRGKPIESAIRLVYVAKNATHFNLREKEPAGCASLG
jgi:hypothetical protein